MQLALAASPPDGCCCAVASPALTRRPLPRDPAAARKTGLRAVEALATSLSLFLVLFASTYLVIATESAGSFSQQLTHTDALYFTVTVFATVGFGDITAKTEAARLVVTGQMIIDLIIIGIGAKIILGAVQQSRQRRPGPPAASRGIRLPRAPVPSLLESYDGVAGRRGADATVYFLQRVLPAQ